MHLAEVEGTEVSEEGFVDQVVVDAEVECMRAGLGRVFVRDPIKAVCDYFYS